MAERLGCALLAGYERRLSLGHGTRTGCWSRLLATALGVVSALDLDLLDDAQPRC
jgi:hypothetical protein